MASASTSVLVVGGGPTGLVAALALVQNGISVRIIEKDVRRVVGQRGAGIQPRTVELYRFLSTSSDIVSQGGPFNPIQMHALQGGTDVLKTITIAVKEPTTGCPDPNVVCLGQDRHEAVLREHLAGYGCKVEFGVELVSLSQDAEKVDVVLRHAQDGHEETATFKWLIGADGGHSPVRKLLGLSFLGESRTDQMLVGDIRVTNPGVLSTEYMHWWGEAMTKFFVIRPTEQADDTYTFFFGGRELDTDNMNMDLEAIVQAFREISGLSDVVLGELVCVSRWRPNIRMVDQFRQGRVLVAGDAAHCHSPTGGQGLNSSVQDAVNLAWKLALVEKGISPPQLLDSYAAERLPVIAAMLNMSTALLNKTFTIGGVLNGGALDRPHELKMLGVTYRGSPIIVEDEGSKGEPKDPYRSGEDGKVSAGDRAPDASIGLFNVFKMTHHTVIIFGKDEQFAKEIFSATRQWRAPVKTVTVVPEGSNGLSIEADFSFVDIDGSAFQNYQVAEKAVVVVRPDGVVGYKSEDASGLKDYAEKVFS